MIRNLFFCCAELETTDYLEFIARVTSHIPDKGCAEMIRNVYEVDPMLCPKCGGAMKIVPFFANYFVFLTTIGSREYHPLVKGSIDSDLNAKGRRTA